MTRKKRAFLSWGSESALNLTPRRVVFAHQHVSPLSFPKWPSQPFVMNLEHKTAAGDVNFSTFVVPPRCPGSPFLSSDSSTEGSTDYSSLDDYSSSESSTDESDYSSSSDDYSDDSSDCSSSSDEEDEESSQPLRKTLIGNHAVISSLPQQDIVSIYSAAMEEEEASETEYMSE